MSKTPVNDDVLTVAQIRQIDEIAVREFGMNSLVLMENAGRGCADFIGELLPAPSCITILCGPGNNGGDGLVIARHLHAMGDSVKLWMIAEPERLSQDARSNLDILEHTKLTIHWLAPSISEPSSLTSDLWGSLREDCASSRMIVDALLGTGATGAPRPVMAQAIQIANDSPATRVAIDIPTGLDVETGIPSATTFQADTTLTFVALKPGFVIDEAKRWLGKVHVLPIGIPPEVLRS